MHRKNKHRIAFSKASHRIFITLLSQNNLKIIAFFLDESIRRIFLCRIANLPHRMAAMVLVFSIPVTFIDQLLHIQLLNIQLSR